MSPETNDQPVGVLCWYALLLRIGAEGKRGRERGRLSPGTVSAAPKTAERAKAGGVGARGEGGRASEGAWVGLPSSSRLRHPRDPGSPETAYRYVGFGFAGIGPGREWFASDVQSCSVFFFSGAIQQQRTSIDRSDSRTMITHDKKFVPTPGSTAKGPFTFQFFSVPFWAGISRAANLEDLTTINVECPRTERSGEARPNT